jgi:signal transduction histidine kinase/ligand-binding sensor domain-containing protein
MIGWIIASALALAWVCNSQAQETNSQPKDLRSEYVVDFWQTEQGLPDNFITSLAQSPDGYLWVGTFSGLARFNGAEFVSFDPANTPELPDSRIVELMVDGAGRLWIRSLSGRFTYWQNGHFRLLPETNPPAIESLAIRLGPKGDLLWARKMADTNYRKFNGKEFEPVRGETRLLRVTGEDRDSDGYGWGVEKGNLFSLNPKIPGEWPVPGFVAPMGWRVKASRYGGVWFVGGNGVKKFRNGQWEDYGSLPIVTELFEGHMEDHLGNFWLGVGVGEIWRANTNHTISRFKLADTAIAQPGKLIIEDAENNLWIGTGGRGVMRVKPRILKSYDSRNGLASDVVRSVSAGADGTIWMATVNSIDCFDNGSETARKRHPEIELPWRVCAGRDGALWVGTFGEGLFRFRDGRWDRYRTHRGTASPPMLKLLQTKNGDMYVGSHRGLFVVDGDELTDCKPPNATQTLDVRALEEGPNGELYIGLNGGGLFRKTGKEWESFTTRNGLSSDHIFALHAGRDGAIWIGTEGKGLSRLANGRVFNFPETIGLPRKIIGIIEDDEGRIWLASNRGLFSADRGELASIAEGRSETAAVAHYDRSDGMGSSECTGDAAKSPDGRLWFSTMFGVTVIDPKSLPRNTRPPPVLVEQIMLDDKPGSNRTNDAFTIPPGFHRLEIRFAGLSFTAPERVRYRYQLDGYDTEWIDAGNRRAAYYTGIQPGEYRFRVRAANNDGVWNDSGATLRISALPYFWQRRPVQAAAILLLATLAVSLARYWTLLRVRHRMAELERRHALDKERGRISRDLHDSLGADLSQLALWTDLALQETDRPGLMAERARDVSELTREVIQNVEEIVWTVNPKNDSLDKFAGYLCEFSERIITRAGLRFRWEAPVEIPAIPISSDVRHHLFLVTKEALNNLVKHAGASEARVLLSLDAGRLAIGISDNGKGCDFATCVSNGGNGLSNMRDRLKSCGGEVTFESAPGAGTSVAFKIPLQAYCDK